MAIIHCVYVISLCCKNKQNKDLCSKTCKFGIRRLALEKSAELVC